MLSQPLLFILATCVCATYHTFPGIFLWKHEAAHFALNDGAFSVKVSVQWIKGCFRNTFLFTALLLQPVPRKQEEDLHHHISTLSWLSLLTDVLFMTKNKSMLNPCAFLFSCRPSWSCNGCSTWSRCVHFEHGSLMSMFPDYLPVNLSNPTPATHLLSLLALGSRTHSVHSTNLCFSFSFWFYYFICHFCWFNVSPQF